MQGHIRAGTYRVQCLSVSTLLSSDYISAGAVYQLQDVIYIYVCVPFCMTGSK